MTNYKRELNALLLFTSQIKILQHNKNKKNELSRLLKAKQLAAQPLFDHQIYTRFL